MEARWTFRVMFLRYLPRCIVVQQAAHLTGYPCLWYNLAMRSGWRKHIAVFFLLWACLDLSVPGVCQTDVRIPANAAKQERLLASGSQGGAVLNSPALDPTLPLQSDGDDCFCCCSHMAVSGPDLAMVLSFCAFEPSPSPVAAFVASVAPVPPPRG